MEETFAKYINVNGELIDLSRPQVMGILNVTSGRGYCQQGTPDYRRGRTHH